MATSNTTRTLGCCLILAALSGCATCERHPVACGAAVAFVATSIALSVDHDRHGSPAKIIHHPDPPHPASPGMTQIPQIPTGPTTY
jgi:hypothetical protein